MVWVYVNAFYLNSSICYTDIIQVKKAKGHIITCHEGTERRKNYRYTSALQCAMVGSQRHTPAGRFTTGKSPGTQMWVGPEVCLEGYGNLAPTGIQTPDHLVFVTINFTMTTISLRTSVTIAHCIYYTITHVSHTGITVYYTAQQYQSD